jgi:hypothetical protein
VQCGRLERGQLGGGLLDGVAGVLAAADDAEPRSYAGAEVLEPTRPSSARPNARRCWSGSVHRGDHVTVNENVYGFWIGTLSLPMALCTSLMLIW